MTTQIKRRRGTTTEHSTFTGAEGEITIDTTKDTVVVHDGSTAGGHPLAKESSIAGKVDSSGDSMTGNLSFGDNDKAIFGAGSDLQIYHDGSNSFISEQGTGNLKIIAQEFVVLNSANDEAIIRGFNDGAVELYYDASKKLATTSTGVDITGTLTSDGLTSVLSGDTQGKFSGWSVVGANTGSGAIELGQTSAYQGLISYAADSNTRFIFDNTYGSTASTFEFRTNTSATPKTHMKITGGGDISFYEDTGTTPKFFWDASAESLGIGTSSPTNQLHVASTANSSIRISAGTSGNNDAKLVLDGNGSGVCTIDADKHLTFTYSGAERMRIDSSGNVGIGTSSPSELLHVNGTIRSGGGTAADPSIKVGDNNTGFYYVGGDVLGVTTGGSERMRIDSSGNLLVGKTSDNNSIDGVVLNSDGIVKASNASNFSGLFNRRTTDGDIVIFRKDNSTVGSIGVVSGITDYLTIGGGGSAGVLFHSTGVRPWNLTTNVANDDAIDLGSSGSRFKDLYLSGGVYLGGTGAANKLDDYEEGTWTPSLGTTGAQPSITYSSITRGGKYVKVGRLVTVNFSLRVNAHSGGSGEYLITGLPFTTSTAVGDHAGVSVGGLEHHPITSTTMPIQVINTNATHVRMLIAQNNTGWTSYTPPSQFAIYMSFSYETNS